MLCGTEMSSSHRRYLYSLALLDQPGDGWTLIHRALLPSREWLRYGDADGHAYLQTRLYLRYLWHVLHSPRF